MKYQDNDHTPDEIRKLEKFVERFADRHPDYYQASLDPDIQRRRDRHIQKVVSEIKPSSKLEALQFEYDAMVEYDRTVRE